MFLRHCHHHYNQHPRHALFCWSWVAVLLVLQLATLSITPSPFCHAEATTSTTAGVFQTAQYTMEDDVSWAITRADKLADAYHQQLYDDYMEKCNQASKGNCQQGEFFRLDMNRRQPSGVYNYTETGFQKIRAPETLLQVLTDFYERNKGKETIEWKQINSYHNMWEAPPHFISLEDASLGGGDDIQRIVWREARQVLEEWTGMRLSPVSMYGVRIYKNNSILAPHVDRMPLVTSCIINIDQDLDEPWPLEVFDHTGKAYNVTMEPGDMVLYESHSVIHGRPFPMKGRAFVNTFLHFEPIGPLDDISQCGPQGNGLPPYVIPGGAWEFDWFKSAMDDWTVSMNVPKALQRGDIRALEYIAYHKPELLVQKDPNGWAPVHEAVYRGDLEGTQFLFENGASIHDRLDVYKNGVQTAGPDCLGLAKQSPRVTDDHPLMLFLLDVMAASEL